jgi:heme d1 biosynthesis radical SAM protein NirJ
MFRVSRFMQEIERPGASAPARGPAGPVVIWNLVRRCNLNCLHCYSISADVDFPGELHTAEVFRVMQDLKAFGVPALILSGGEPLLRKDLFEIAARSREMGFYTGLSTNGTLIDAAMAGRIATTGFDYVGVSLDGLRDTHDRFRRRSGAFDASLAGIRHCLGRGIKVGLRFTLTRGNAADLPGVLELAEREGVDKFYLSHLNYAGRGNRNRAEDAEHALTRKVMEALFERCWDYQRRGLAKEFVTGNNDADGAYLLGWVRRRFPGREAHIRARLEEWGGNASGVNVANIDNLGNVHPDTMWWDTTLGNVRERPFPEIWNDTSGALMAGLKRRPRPVKGRCAQCTWLSICNGSSRVRALQLTGDPWEEDPGCYLTDEEIGIAPGGQRVPLAPYRGREVRWLRSA